MTVELEGWTLGREYSDSNLLMIQRQSTWLIMMSQ